MSGIKKIAVLTSGGDAPGMNATVRGVVRAALNKGLEVYGVKDAYRGLVEGGRSVFPLDWVDVSWTFREGGTFLGSSRYPEFKGSDVMSKRLKEAALLTLKNLGISGLVVIGGDGSLSGGNELAHILKQTEHINPDLTGMELSIVGIPASIDNDIACTDMSIGVDTALNTIVECIDKLRDTAASHKRIIIVEVMGRLRGYLAVMSGLATGADRVFIREEKIKQRELNRMLTVLQESFAHGQKAGIIVRSEGAGFSTNFVKEIIAVLLEPKREVRETVLGHLQRGGNPTAFERILATRMGIKAVQLLEEGLSEPQMVGLIDNEIKHTSLAESLAKIKTPNFQEKLSTNARNAFYLSRKLEDPPGKAVQGIRIGIITDGNNVSGMNMAIRAVARLAINMGIQVKGIKGGFSGLSHSPGNTLNLEWGMLEMKSILRRAGTLLGVSSSDFIPDENSFHKMKKYVEDLNIQGLIVIGNNKTYQYCENLSDMIHLPVVGIPASLNCNVPGTDSFIGMDSALNDLTRGIDRTVEAAHVQKKIFIIHIKGDYCSCLVKSAGLAGGVEQIIIEDTESHTKDQDLFRNMVIEQIQEVNRIIKMGKSFSTIIFFSKEPEKAEEAIEFIKEAIEKSSIKLETTVVPLETSYGGSAPTAFDRILAKRFGERAISTLLEKIKMKDFTFHVAGIKGKHIVATSYKDKIVEHECICVKKLKSTLRQNFDLMTQPSKMCVGMGGDVQWTNTKDRKNWKGIWNCKQCGQSQTVSFAPEKMLCVHCRNERCHNYGYIRISRRL